MALHIAHFIPALGVGGAEKLLITFAAAVQKTPHKMTVVMFHDLEDAELLKPELEALGVSVILVPFRKLINVSQFRALVKLCKEERFDVIHTHLTRANILGALAGYRSGIPVVTSLHNVNMRSQKHLYHGRLETYLLNYFVDKIIAVGWSTAEAHQKRLHRKKIEVIPNAVKYHPNVSLDDISCMRQSIGAEPNETALLAVGRLNIQKAYPDMLSAVDIARQTFPNLKLYIAGRGQLKDELEEEIEQKALGEHVKMLGFVRDIPTLLSSVQIFINSSHWEGMPVSILEAMGAGKPIIATEVGDVPKVVGTDGALLVPPGQPSALASAICSLMSNPSQREAMGIAAKNHVDQTFNEKVWLKRLLNVYESVI